MKTLELTMKVVEDRSAPLMFTEKNLPGMCCCTCCCSCCVTIGDNNSAGDTIANADLKNPSLQDAGKTLAVK